MPEPTQSVDGLKQVEIDSQASSIPAPHVEAHRLEVENLKWQIEYEKKLHDQLSQLLENKVSNLMAQVKRLEKTVSQ